MNFASRNLIDYFSVCGLDIKHGLELEPHEFYEEELVIKPPMERSYKCRILNHYPDNLPWNPFDKDAVAQMCLPKGLLFQKHCTNPAFHPFLITREDGSHVFGGTLTFYELIEDESICNAMHSLQTMYDTEFVSDSKMLSKEHAAENHQPSSSQLRFTHSERIISSTSNVLFVDESVANVNSKPQHTPDNVSFTIGDTNTTEKKSTSSVHRTSISNDNYSVGKSTNNGSNQSTRQKYCSQLAINTPIGSNSESSSNNSNNVNASSFSCVREAVASPCRVVHYNMLKDRLYASKCICVLSQRPFNRAFRKILQTIYDMVEQTDLLGINLESHLYNLLYDIPMPIQGELLCFQVGCKSIGVYLPDYSINCSDLPLLDYDLFEVFRLLGVNNMISLYITALLEHQILLYSKDYYHLMLVAESLRGLFFPFVWLKPYVPIVPASNLRFIEAPVPYIMGFHHRDIDKEFFRQSQRCFVDIDSGTVSCPEGLPDFPDKNKFIGEINQYIAYFTQKRTRGVCNDDQSSELQDRTADKQIQSDAIKQIDTVQSDSNLLSSQISYNEHNEMNQMVNQLKEASKECTATPHSTLSSNNLSYDQILQNSQAFSRIAELARKAGAINSKNEYVVDSSNGRLRTSNHDVTNTTSSTGSSIINRYLASSVVRQNETDKRRVQSYATEKQACVLTDVASKTSAASCQHDSDDLVSKSSLSRFAINEDELVCLQFASCVRELFLQHFVHMFASYEKFVIIPKLKNNQLEHWWLNREYSGNFDSKMFLIEQPSPRIPFLSHFISTQMFASFIDLKIISIIDPSKEPDPNVKIFDQRIRQFKENELQIGANSYDLKAENVKSSFDPKKIEKHFDQVMHQEPIYAPRVHSLKSNRSNWIQHTTTDVSPAYALKSTCLFENLNNDLLKADEDLINTIYREMKMEKESDLKRRELFINSLNLGVEKKNKEINKNLRRERRTRKQTQELISNSLSANQSQFQGSIKYDKMVQIQNVPVEKNEKTTEQNPFIQSLLKESKLKTKRMLVEKMPDLSANLGQCEMHISGIEENMLIASLCDLIERIWGHGLHNQPGKSALWNHLNNYRKLIQYLHPKSQTAINEKHTPSKQNILSHKRLLSSDLQNDKTSIYHRASSQHESVNIAQNQNNQGSNSSSSSNLINLFYQNPQQTVSHHKRAQSVSNKNETTFPLFKVDLLADLSRIDKLSEVKTEIGMARAFVRLSLEKKLLADHLRQLLDQVELLRALYKRHAFLRQEEEREQFIFHLQSLNVVDYFCFSNHFRSIPTDYSVIIVPSKKFNSSTTSANPYLKLYGSLGESTIFFIPKNAFEFVISCTNNLGPLTALAVGHDNVGITPRWMIECIFVRSEITGHVHRFPCGRWLGKGVDDDSLERLLIAESINHNEANGSSNTPIYNPYNLYSNYIRSRSPSIIKTEEKSRFTLKLKVNSLIIISVSKIRNFPEELQPTAIQELIDNTINKLKKYFEKAENERGSLTSIMCGEMGMVKCMDNIFSFGFKSYKMFKRLYVWDFLEKSCWEFEASLYSVGNPKCVVQNHVSQHNGSIEKYISAIRSINSTAKSYGKDGKFQIFICLACRDSLLADWFVILSKSNKATEMYDEYSFLRNYELNNCAVHFLSLANKFSFKLENSLTMDILF